MQSPPSTDDVEVMLAQEALKKGEFDTPFQKLYINAVVECHVLRKALSDAQTSKDELMTQLQDTNQKLINAENRLYKTTLIVSVTASLIASLITVKLVQLSSR